MKMINFIGVLKTFFFVVFPLNHVPTTGIQLISVTSPRREFQTYATIIRPQFLLLRHFLKGLVQKSEVRFLYINSILDKIQTFVDSALYQRSRLRARICWSHFRLRLATSQHKAWPSSHSGLSSSRHLDHSFAFPIELSFH